MSQHKIIFSGPVGAGKTTAITSLSDTPPVSTEQLASDETRLVKATTTVAMDYGVIRLGGEERIHLYGTPGQERFDFMWEILSQGAIGLVLLISNARPDPYADLHLFMNAYRPFAEQNRLVVGVTQMDLETKPSLNDYRRRLLADGLHTPVFEVDARRRQDISVLVQVLLLGQDPGMEN
ncbi:MAG: ATP/GTP-binding protein [Pseudomonadota bacterium]